MIKEIPDGLPLTRAQIAISIVGQLMRPDDNKTTTFNALFHAGTWLQGPWESLNERRGLGGCGDYATLLCETLIRTGTPEQDITLIGGVHPDMGFHFVDGLEIGETKYVLDPVHYTLDEPDLPKVPGVVIVKYEDYIIRCHRQSGRNKNLTFFSLI